MLSPRDENHGPSGLKPRPRGCTWNPVDDWDLNVYYLRLSTIRSLDPFPHNLAVDPVPDPDLSSVSKACHQITIWQLVDIDEWPYVGAQHVKVNWPTRVVSHA